MNSLTRAVAKAPLNGNQIEEAVAALLDESFGIETRAEFLEALQRRGPSAEELAGFARALLERAVPVAGVPGGCIDVCGTGGDRAGFFNVSTAVMFVAAGAGARVAKHGNRGITSKCGGADVLEALGIAIDTMPEDAARSLQSTGCAFFFAPHYHPAVKAVAPVRKFLAEKGLPSIFNLLGPLINPARPDFQLVGVFDPTVLPLYAAALHGLGRRAAWVVHGTGPGGLALDEISPCGATQIAEANKAVREVTPAQLGISEALPGDLVGGDAAHNAKIIRSILDGSDRGPRRDIVVINAAAALVVCGIAPDLSDGISRAAKAIDSGHALTRLAAMQKA
jgi:anthranilate phosphoribosyltransferase